jgi:hypothetical protein
MTNAFSAAELALYLILSPPAVYLLARHFRFGFLGWAYLLAFCGLRIIGGALGLNDANAKTAAIISSIGLSPLLLAAAGILHEA